MKKNGILAALLVFSLFTLFILMPESAIAKTTVSIKGGTLITVENGYTSEDLPAVKGMEQGVLKSGAEVLALIEMGQMRIQIANGTFVSDSGQVTYIRDGEDISGTNHVTLAVNNVILHPDVPPRIINGRAMVPLAIIASNLGLSVNYEPATRTVTATDGHTTLKLMINGHAYKNGVQLAIDVPAMIQDGRTLVPAAFISTAFGARVSWDESSRTVNISYQKDERG